MRLNYLVGESEKTHADISEVEEIELRCEGKLVGIFPTPEEINFVDKAERVTGSSGMLRVFIRP